MSTRATSSSTRPRLRRLVGALTAVVLGAGLTVAASTPAVAGAFTVSIAATNATTQPSGSEFTYQINLACAATNDPTCDSGQITIPLDDPTDISAWDIEVAGALVESFEVVGGALVITLPAVIPAGTSQAIELRVTPPNLTTPSGTTWSLLPSVAGDPETTVPAVAPEPASGTATATVPLSVSKGSDRTFYREGETIEYSIAASCPTGDDLPLGSIAAETMTIVDTLSLGIEPVLPIAGADWDAVARTITWVLDSPDEIPTACGGTASGAALTFEAVVGAVGDGEQLASYDQVTNVVSVTATPLGGGEPAVETDDRVVVVLDETDDPAPGTANVTKNAAGPVNTADAGSPRFDGTYPGRWLPTAVAPGAPASVTAPNPARYTIEPRTQFPGFEYEIVDALPCLADLDGVVYSPSAGTCATPAFHVLGIRLDHPGAAPSAGYTPRYVDLAGVEHDLEAGSTGTNWTGWVIPTAAIGQVSGIVIPRDASQIDRRSDRITVYGFADASTSDGQVLHNIADAAWFAPGAATPLREDSDPADILVVDTPQLGVTKAMTNIGGPTGTLARLELGATLMSPGTPDSDLILTDLLPAGASFATDVADMSATIRPDGGTAVSLPAGSFELVEDFVDGRDLLRITAPAALMESAGRYLLDVADIEVTKPTAPGVYDNAAQAFYDSATLSGACAAGSFANTDADGLRGDDTTTEEHCRATAQFSTATSTSGAFDLRKTVQGDYDEEPQEFPNVAHVKLTDGLADYEIIWQNTGAPTLDGVVLYDIFPHVGDTGVAGNQADQQRESEFRPLLAEIGAVPAGVTLSFSASENPCRPEVYPGQGACDDDWTTDADSLGGLAEVAAIRLVSADDYATGEGISLPFRMSVPTVDKDMVAWNSVAAFAQTTGGTALLPTESPKVGITASDNRFAFEKTVDLANAQPGDELTYGLVVTNVGTADSVSTTVTDPLPTGVTFVSASHGGVYTAADRTVEWTLPILARDESLTLQLVVTVDAVQTDGEIANLATLETPPGYSPNLVISPCDTDPTAACAVTEVPITSTGEMANTGATIPWWAIVSALTALLAGGLALAASRRARGGRHVARS